MLRDEAERYIKLEENYGENSAYYHYNCAEVMLNASNDYYDLGLDNKSLRMIVPFGGGMYTENDCGMLTGGVAVLGVMLTEEKPSNNLKLKEATSFWVNEFEKEFKGLNCRFIKDRNLAENQGCSKLILKAADILEEVIGKYK